MSADNFICIIPGDKDSLGRVSAWFVSSGFMSYIEDPDSEEKYIKQVKESNLPYSSRESALVAAHDLAAKEPILEYGVFEL